MLTLSLIPGLDTGTLVTILAAIAIAIALHRMNKRGDEAPLAKSLTEHDVQSLSDDNLVRAFAWDILSRTDRRRPDIYALLPTLSHGQIAAYSVWVVCNELREAPLANVLRSQSKGFCELAVDGFSLIGATACEQALQAALEAPASDDALRAAIEQEQPLALCAAYIRENPAEFL